MFYYYDSSYFLYAIVTTLVTLYAYFRVQVVFSKYSKVKCKKNITGLFSAENMLMQNEVDNVVISHVPGNRNDHFDPRTNRIVLSEFTYFDNSITSISVASHEAGHAVQYAKNYSFSKIRQNMVPITQICSNLSMPMVIIGLILPVGFSFIVDLGIILFSVSVLFHLVTLPVEFDASRRAIIALETSGYLTNEELQASKKVLRAAAFTYMASLFTSVMYLIRLLSISSSRKKNNS